MSILIDELIHNKENTEEVDYKEYISKPLDKIGFMQRLRDAKMVLCGYARAYHYFEDEANTLGEVI